MMRLVSSLTNRIFVALTLLVVVSLGFAATFANARASREAEAELGRGLVEAATLVDQHRATLTATFTRMARLVADLPVVKAALETHHAPTVQPLAEQYLAQIDADVLVLHDDAGRRLGAAGVALADDALRHAPGDADERSTFLAHPQGVLQVVSVPILLGADTPGVLGRLTVGFLMDDALATQFQRLTGSEIIFAAEGRVIASSLPLAGRPSMADFRRAIDTTTIRLGEDEYVALLRPMQRAADGDASPVTVTLRSRSERLRSLTALRAGMAGALVVTLLLATVLSYLVARTVTRPLAAVTDAMREVAATGDLTHKVSVRSRAWDDADARLLATSFNTLTESIARFQRESAQKDRLSALGRLSTVIAHEIRNPLMIVWASLATLHDPGTTPEEQREAVADIDAESKRINRIVTEVLDFAKPITFELATTSVNDVCRASAHAAWAGQDTDGPEGVALELDDTMPPAVTDGERLRAALVNLLTNARQAVTRAPSTTPASDAAAITLRTERRDDHVIITVRDRGIGITPEDMTHIFDPYFTTRRAGTGIGLAITRNIVEGLGGTIAVTSQVGVGTEFQLDLPLTSREAA